MNVKIDTKEKFTVITPQEEDLTANMTEELSDLLLSYLQKDIPHLVLNLQWIEKAGESPVVAIAHIQKQFYDNHFSFVICNMQEEVEEILEKKELLERMNITHTETEAWDMVQMEEIERELLRDEE